MQALLYSIQAEELDILSLVFQRAGIMTRSTRSLDHTLETWSDEPSDFILLSSETEQVVLIDQVTKIRSTTISPIILIADPMPESHLLQYYEAGVDLVVVRPYSPRVLLRQVEALLKRSNSMPLLGLPTMQIGALALDPSTRSVTVGKHGTRHLTQLEFRLLYTLLIHANQVIPSERLVEFIWGYSGEGNRELVRGLVQRLRAKIEVDPHDPKFILTEPGIGYSFKKSVDPD